MKIKIGKIFLELPYYNTSTINNNDNNNNNQQQHQKKYFSYGILCISKDGYMVMNKSPPYIKTHIMNKKKKQINNNNNNNNIGSSYNINNKNNKNNKSFCKLNFDNININTNEYYNLLLNSFPNSSLEGEYTLPKGKIDNILDKKNCIYTKVREFIEETKYTHPSFSSILNKHYKDPNFKSFLNNEKFILRETWIGLDNKIYNCEYSVFIIESMNELNFIGNRNNIVPFNYFLTYFDVYKNCDKYHKKYKQSSNLDRKKTTLFISINEGIDLLNQHKINIYKNNDNRDSRIQASDIYSITVSS